MSGNVFFNSIPFHSQWFIPIPIPDLRFSLVLYPFPSYFHWLFPFPPASIPIRVDILVFCQFIAALLLIVFWVAEIIKVEDIALLSWWAMTVECVTVRRSSRRSLCTTEGLVLSSNWKWENVEFSFPPIPIKPFPFPFP